MTDFLRAVVLDDIRIRTGGTGRTVEAYAAIFDTPAEISDADGHYLEVNHRAAFDRSIARNRGRFPVLYHHGLTIAGTPSDRGSVPIGVSVEARADSKGVLTVSEYGRSDLADEVLEAIKAGAITGQSYGGRFLRSDPDLRRGSRSYRPNADGTLRTVTRMEVAMREFGPTPFPAFTGASIVGVRAALADLVLLAQHDADVTTSDREDGARSSGRGTPDIGARPDLRDRIRRARIARGIE